MSKFSEYSKKETVSYRQFGTEQEINFMNGISYRVNPLKTLQMIAASSIFGEASYYRDSHDNQKFIDKILPWGVKFESNDPDTTTHVFIKVIDEALHYDFKATLDLALELRTLKHMRLNPALIIVRAAMHAKRKEFNHQHKNFFRETAKAVILRPDDITNQFDLWMFFNRSKNKLPSLLKRVWKDQLESYSRYHLAKYRSKSLIDAVRISHANNELIDELMQNGKIETSEEEKTWENLRSAQKTWPQILQTTYVPHMALLRNLRNIFRKEEGGSEVEDVLLTKVIEQLKNGVASGKQFPFRYYSAYNEIDKAEVWRKGRLLDCLEECIDLSLDNFPKLTGKTICLSDNSGSSWGAIPSAYGSVTVAIIANLSSIITALQSDEGYVGVFGDRLSIKPVSKRNGILSQLSETNERGKAQGGSTENGIWLFFSEAIQKKQWYDHIFIYSDMQAGHGGLYGTNKNDYKDFIVNGNYIDVLKLVMEYRRLVNPRVNIYSVQVAGYKNSVVPENLYRCSILSGWTGQEVVYASYLNQVWDSMERSAQQA